MIEESLARSTSIWYRSPGFSFRWARKFDGNLYDPPSEVGEFLRFVLDVVLDSVFHLVNCLQFIST